MSVRRLAFVRLVFFVFFILITLQLFNLQVVNHELYADLASGQHNILSQLIPERGEIYVQDPLSESKVYPVAVNKQLNFVYASPKDVVDPQVVSAKLAPILNMDVLDLEEILNKPNDPWEPLKHYVTDEIAELITNLKLPGIFTIPETMRFYTEGPLFSQLVGYVGFNNDKKEGQYGVEGYWEKELAGKKGELRSEKDPAGSLITLGQREIIPAVPGVNLILTIDKNIQIKACLALESAVKKHGAAKGSLIIMDPTTGAIKALCNSPSFDPNSYAEVRDISRFINNAVSSPYEPGSVFKPITMAGALAEGVVTPTSTYIDTGEIKIGPEIIKNSDNKAHGLQTMTGVLENSLNTGAIFVMRQLGVKSFLSYMEKFGFGKITGIDLPHEKSGNINRLSEKQEIYSVTASFGQGITVTPLQMLNAFGAIANKGQLMRPYVVDEIRFADGRAEKTRPTIIRQVFTSQVARTLSAMLVSVVERGHGKRAGVAGYYVAGKTGTAQVPMQNKAGYDPHKTIGTFVGFAPVDQPKFVMLAKIDEPKGVTFAENSAAPLFGEIAKFLLEYYQVPPERATK
jgi:cell division protein FtsI/penicillin-binding protein 2